MAASVKTGDLKKAIKNILKDADLDSLSAKKVRRKLEEMFGIELTDRKQEIDALTMKMITEGQEEEESEKEEKPKSKSKKTTSIKSKGNDHVTRNGRAGKDL
ncbi:chitin synthase 5-like [Haliotis rubra]|uniref:chitin synthase 5-like n=1 Tax=Haliotis rubra TaxID=36100 RepID=UPI001EE5E194|nr:chitin synthase 5-like [Haliotis rubra]